MNEEEKNKNVKNILNKWLEIQNSFKEEITLEETTLSTINSNNEILKENYYKFYENKIKAREIYENILYKEGNNNNNILNKYEIDKQSELILKDAYNPIQKLLFLFRSNYDYIVKLFSILNEIQILTYNSNEINSIIYLFCHQFYNNILIPNPEQEEFLILIYFLLEKEINEMFSANINLFLNDKNNILGRIFKSFTKKYEIKNYLTLTLGNFIINLQNNENEFIELEIDKILKYVEENEENFPLVNVENSKEIFQELLTKNIYKCNIEFNDNSNLELVENNEKTFKSKKINFI